MIDHHPLAHLRPETGWTNDPTGPIHWHGRTHLFHQYNPAGGFWDRPHWGHLVTDDLVHWQRRPIALSPDPDGPDADGCFSGCVVADGDQAVMVYTGARGPGGPEQQQTTCLARSTDPELDRWVKEPTNPVTTPPEHLDLVGFRDPFVWREQGRWWQLVGAGVRGIGGAVLLFTSVDLVRWHDAGTMLTGPEIPSEEWTGAMWECPALVRGLDADVLLINVHDGDTTSHPLALVGERDGTRFRPTRVQRLDLGPDLYAPCVYEDARGRVVSWGWCWEARSLERQREAGWAGVLSWPRELTVVDGVLHVRPLPETVELRGQERRIVAVPSDDGWCADGAEGDALELEVTLGPAADRLAIRIRRAPQLEEVTTIEVDRQAGELWVDRDRSSLDPEALGGRVGGSMGVATAGDLHLRIVVDRSIVEVFAADRVALTARIYPIRADSLGVEVVGQPSAVADVALRAWTLGTIWRADPDDPLDAA
jgi:beta-fructofuranosidase